MNKKIRLMLARDKELFRRSLAALLKTNPTFEIIAEARNGKELLEQMKHNDADIILIDAEMTVMDGRATMDTVQLRFPLVRIMVLSNNDSHYQSNDFMSRGAACYLTTDCNVDTLFKAISTVASEGYYFDSSISKALLGAVIKGKKTGDALADVSFNDREIGIIKAVCDGKTNKEIAASLHVSGSTVDFYKCRIYEKINCNTVAGLVKYAIKRGIIMLPD